MFEDIGTAVRKALDKHGVRSLDELSHDAQIRLAGHVGLPVPELHRAIRASLAQERRQELAQIRAGGRGKGKKARKSRRIQVSASGNVSMRGTGQADPAAVEFVRAQTRELPPGATRSTQLPGVVWVPVRGKKAKKTRKKLASSDDGQSTGTPPGNGNPINPQDGAGPRSIAPILGVGHFRHSYLLHPLEPELAERAAS
jgi:hypothetical protein